MQEHQNREVRLSDGTTVSSYSEQWRAECESRFRHVQNLLVIKRKEGVTEYLRDVQNKEGREAAIRVWDRYKQALAERNQAKEY